MNKPLFKPKAVLFDLDGTLVDTADDLGAALNFVLRQYGRPAIAPALYRPVASHGAKGLLELGFAKTLAEYDFSVLRQQFLAFYADNLATHSRVFSGTADLLAALAHAQIRWGIVTNKPYKLAAALLRQLPVLNDCAVLLGGDSLAQRKPSPVPLLVAAHQLKVPARQCWYLGDAERDIEAANRARMLSVLAGYGYIAADDQIAHWQAAVTINQLSELLPALR